jgi:uncharacterized protein YpmB
MSTIIIAVILILIIISICLILVSINNKHRQKTTTELFTRSGKLGTENNLSFSKQEILENCLIGLDEIQRKLLIVKKIDEDKYDSLLLDLNEVKSCSKEKIYKKINIGTAKKEKFENHIEKIALAVDFIDNRQPVQISFFEPMSDHLLKMAELDQKAKDWETILNKIVNTRLKKIA